MALRDAFPSYLNASKIADYAIYPDETCADALGIAKTPQELAALKGIRFHYLLGNAAKTARSHIEWSKTPPVEQARKYLPKNYLSVLASIMVPLTLLGWPLGLAYKLWDANEHFLLKLGAWILSIFLFACLAAVLNLPRRGLAKGKALAIDNITLRSSRFPIAGRPDRIVQIGKWIIPEEWKSYKTPDISAIIQLSLYMLLVEEHYKVRPPYGMLIMGNGHRYKIKNSKELQARALHSAHEMCSLIRHIKESYNMDSFARAPV